MYDGVRARECGDPQTKKASIIILSKPILGRHGVWAVHGSPVSGILATGGGDATVKVWAPTSASAGRSAAENRVLSGDKRLGDERGTPPGWECVGGVRGTIGAVGAVLITEDEMFFGTSEALIARFPLQSCMPVP